jgi:hypothetical protein
MNGHFPHHGQSVRLVIDVGKGADNAKWIKLVGERRTAGKSPSYKFDFGKGEAIDGTQATVRAAVRRIREPSVPDNAHLNILRHVIEKRHPGRRHPQDARSDQGQPARPGARGDGGRPAREEPMDELRRGDPTGVLKSVDLAGSSGSTRLSWRGRERRSCTRWSSWTVWSLATKDCAAREGPKPGRPLPRPGHLTTTGHPSVPGGPCISGACRRLPQRLSKSCLTEAGIGGSTWVKKPLWTQPRWLGAKRGASSPSFSSRVTAKRLNSVAGM